MAGTTEVAKAFDPRSRPPVPVEPPESLRLFRRASIIGQIAAPLGALSAFWLDATSTQYHFGLVDAAGWGMGMFLFAALPLWLAARQVDAHPRLVAAFMLACGAWLALPAVYALIDPSIFVAPEYMIEPTRAPEGIRGISVPTLASGCLLFFAAYLALKGERREAAGL